MLELPFQEILRFPFELRNRYLVSYFLAMHRFKKDKKFYRKLGDIWFCSYYYRNLFRIEVYVLALRGNVNICPMGCIVHMFLFLL